MNSTLGSIVPLAMFRFHLCATRVHQMYHSWKLFLEWQIRPNQRKGKPDPPLHLEISFEVEILPPTPLQGSGELVTIGGCVACNCKCC